ncbi:MAG: VF530 family DNA-binding protein, partial [Flavobacteriales bacterium]
MSKLSDRITKKEVESQPNNPLHGIRLDSILNELHAEYGWKGLAEEVNINCFKSNPTMKSSLKFLRKTPWARAKVERLYLEVFGR